MARRMFFRLTSLSESVVTRSRRAGNVAPEQPVDIFKIRLDRLTDAASVGVRDNYEVEFRGLPGVLVLRLVALWIASRSAQLQLSSLPTFRSASRTVITSVPGVTASWRGSIRRASGWACRPRQ